MTREKNQSRLKINIVQLAGTVLQQIFLVKMQIQLKLESLFKANIAWGGKKLLAESDGLLNWNVVNQR
jgi:hypothetical protein